MLGDRRGANDRWEFLIDKDKKIGYVRISSFIQNTADELRKALDQLKEEGVKGLILDLRDNPGGLLSAAVEISDIFLEKGKVVSTEGRNTIPKSYLAQKDSPFEDLPLVVLINQNSASASEIVSAALQDNNRATIIGQRSYGKGSVQNLLELEDGSSVLKLTVAGYHRPNGDNIHRFRDAKVTDKWGVSPNPGMEVKLPPASTSTGSWDAVIATSSRPPKACASLLTQNRSAADEKAKADDKAKADEKAKTDEKAKAKTDDKPKPRTRLQYPSRAGPYVDKVLDKALDVIKSKLAEESKAKAA